MKWLGSVLRGLTHAPWLVGLARGIAEAAALAALATAAGGIGIHIPPEYTVAFWAAVRTAEGVLDQIDPAKQRATGDAAA